jgi:hypothetical protein
MLSAMSEDVAVVRKLITKKHSRLHGSRRRSRTETALLYMKKGRNSMQQRPTGITILAVLAGIVGVLSLLGAIAVFGAGAAVGAAGLGAIGGIIFLVVAVLELAFAYGAWTLQPWAWTLGVGAQILNIVLAIVNVIQGASIGSIVIGLIFNAAILYYLMTPDIKRAFGKA